MRGSNVVRTSSVAMVLIATLAAVSVVDLMSERNVGLRVERVTSRYLEADGGVARANVYSAEEADQVRQYVAEKELGQHDEGSDRDATLTRLRDLDDKIGEALADASNAMAVEAAESDPLVDQSTLTRIRGRLARIRTNEHADLERQAALILALDQGDPPVFRRSFNDLTRRHANYDDYIDATRWMTFQAAQDAGGNVARFQKRTAVFNVALFALAGALTLIVVWFMSRKMVRSPN